MQERLTVEGYVVDELIGFGGTGEVWRGLDLVSGDTVALKRLRTKGPGATERLRREGALLASVAGPHVIGIRRMVVNGDEAVLVMDHAAGGSLAGVLAVRGKLPATEVVTILAPLATALAAAHARNLIHGDLTPANVLFTAEGRPLLADFGVARVLGTTEQRLEGTADFLDPAVAAGAEPTTASDIFALGAVGYTALAGRSPWGSGPVEEVLGRAARGERPLLAAVAPETPAALIVAIESMLSPDPYDRPDARGVSHAILRSSAAAPIGLVHSPPPVAAAVTHPVRIPRAPEEAVANPPRTGRLSRRLMTVVGVLGALAAAAALGVGWAQLGHHNQARALAAAPSVVTEAPAPPRLKATAPDPSATTPTTWGAIVVRFDQLRAEAFTTAQAGPLAQVYVTTAAAYQTDEATVRSLASRGLHAQGFTATVESVTTEASTSTTEQLRVVDELSGYTLLDSTGVVRGRGKPRPAKAFTMTLTRAAAGWRVVSITPT